MNKILIGVVILGLIFLGFYPWTDSFNGTTLDPSKWTVREGSWSPEYHLARNVTLSGGVLTITAKPEEYGGLHYTSGMIYTQLKADWRYGRIEVRAKMPSGSGLLPAIWMLPSTMTGWTDDPDKTNGEIDIAETSTMWWGDYRIKGTLWYGAPLTENFGVYQSPVDITQGYHIYRMDWTQQRVRFYFDGTMYYETSSWFSSVGAYPHPFDDSFFLIIMLGVREPGITSEKQMKVDWVHVYAPPTFTFMPIAHNCQPGTIPLVECPYP